MYIKGLYVVLVHNITIALKQRKMIGAIRIGICNQANLKAQETCMFVSQNDKKEKKLHV